MKRLACVLLFAVVGSGAAEVIDLGTRRELFVDRFLIEKLDGAQLRLHEPHRDGIALKFDQPWEGGFSAYITVIKDGGQNHPAALRHARCRLVFATVLLNLATISPFRYKSHVKAFEVPRGLGLRQSSAALGTPRPCESGRGLPQSKTLSRRSSLASVHGPHARNCGDFPSLNR